ncbi:hypothetical protein IQ266_11210 [filamentous cyanobacterium LEGE 11480]|uniref:Lipoprotein n=1 Tax=Romeriopsis navalis LEGE 11480 TaxID=2777977 RepID=A0A928VL40_9CYAN|nr:hypothetical protein [Romeriopsis navalis]MBE9030300.1 hypothetical protein [Romeriopsis navalis LEGE 11480]
MRKPWMPIGMMLSISLLGCSANSANTVNASNPADQTALPAAIVQAPAEIGRVYIANRQISLMPPAGFVSMPAAEIQQQYPTSSPPNYVFTNADRSASIAISFTQQPLTLKQLPELQKLMSQHMEKTLPGIKWVQRDFMAINGGSWVKLEAISTKKDAKLHSDMYFTTFQNRMLGVNFSATVDQYAAMKAAFAKSRDSIQIATGSL